MDELTRTNLVRWISLAVVLITVASQSELLISAAPYMALALALANAVLAWLNNQHATVLKREAAVLEVAQQAQANREAVP